MLTSTHEVDTPRATHPNPLDETPVGDSRVRPTHKNCTPSPLPQVTAVINEALAAVIGDQQFAPGRSDGWTGGVTEACLKRLVAWSRPYKYLVVVNLSQKAGTGVHAACTARWSPTTDGRACVLWENGGTQAVVTVFWLAV